MASIADMFSTLKLTDRERVKGKISLAGKSRGEGDARRRSLLCRSLCPRDVDNCSLQEAMKRPWGDGFTIHKLAPYTFKVVFRTVLGMEKVISGKPWSFVNFLLVVRVWEDGWDKKEGFFMHEYFWVHGVGLAMHHCEVAVGQLLAAMIEADCCELREADTGLWFFRLKICHPLDKPLQRFVQLHVDDDKVLVNLEYERFPFLCSSCGLMFHTKKHCTDIKRELTAAEASRKPYGNLRASRRSILLENIVLRSVVASEDDGDTLQLVRSTKTPTVRSVDDDKGVPQVQVQVGFGHDSSTYRVDLPPNLFSFMAGGSSTNKVDSSVCGPRRRVRSSVARQPLLLESITDEPEPYTQGKKRKISVGFVSAESAVQTRQEP